MVLSATVKTYPMRPALSNILTIADLSPNSSAVLNVTENIASKYPPIMDEGFAETAFFRQADGRYLSSSSPMIPRKRSIMPKRSRTSRW